MPLAGGEDTCVYRFHAASSAVPQVLCVLPPQQSMASLTRMQMIVSALSTAGVKTPQYLRICADAALFGGLATVMDFIEGLPLEFGNIGHARLLGQFHAELHSKDVSSVINTLDAHRLPREQWLSPDTIHWCLFRWSQNHSWLKPVIDWMDDNFDLDQDLAICHGHFRPKNILVRNSELVGIVDWNFGRSLPPVHGGAEQRCKKGLSQFLLQVQRTDSQPDRAASGVFSGSFSSWCSLQQSFVSQTPCSDLRSPHADWLAHWPAFESSWR